MNSNWENWEREMEEESIKETLKNAKSGSIAFIKDDVRLRRLEKKYWEDYLSSSDYWKNWQKKINSFQTQKEVNFYTSRLHMFIKFAAEYFRSVGSRDLVNTPKLMEQELKRLENISEEEFRKNDKWSGIIKEMDVKEISDFLEWDDNKQESSKNSNDDQLSVKNENPQGNNNWGKGLVWGSISMLGLLGLIVGMIKWKRG